MRPDHQRPSSVLTDVAEARVMGLRFPEVTISWCGETGCPSLPLEVGVHFLGKIFEGSSGDDLFPWLADSSEACSLSQCVHGFPRGQPTYIPPSQLCLYYLFSSRWNSSFSIPSLPLQVSVGMQIDVYVRAGRSGVAQLLWWCLRSRCWGGDDEGLT